MDKTVTALRDVSRGASAKILLYIDNEVKVMAISYKRLFKLMIDKDLKKKDLIRMTGISYSTIRKLENGENMNVEVLEKICRALDCTFDEIVELLPLECGQEKCTDISVE